ncbi:hypothetical protein [Streptomyces afghaniensis]|uniref:hypothetical protein n=1 Tax=Streptomyces afghaniensis TaxID=66865 RepID=UPI0037A14A44
MSDTPPQRPALTPLELALLADPDGVRGYAPRDRVAEPQQAPTEPAGASERPAASDVPDGTPPETSADA